uniref:Reverse transcriptase domain-containing protein n=1 Tax=Tanacetum cinerariifolium TaxID=118510 RepID=A0A6L2LBY6_TANCI|nr:reverse transcriptase domain-containing protein [Tanacetum cinerariifolium]
MAVVFAFDKFRFNLILSKIIVHADHSALKHLFKKQDAKPRLIHWILLLQEFDIEIKDRKGTENVAVDHLSQIETDESSDDSKVDDNFPGETFMEINIGNEPWFADFVNHLLADIIPKKMTYQQKNKFFSGLKHYFWEEPYLFKCVQTRSSRLVSNPCSNPTPSTNPNPNPKGRNRRRSKQRIEEFNLKELSPLIVMMADQRTMAQLLQAPTEGYEDAIVVPAITADNFKLKHGLLTLQFDESFSEAWDRFKDLVRAFPHHGFSELHQLDTFYNALNSKDRDSLNSAAGGHFLDKMPHECLAIIESKSKDMVKALLIDKKSQNQAPATVKAVEESCVTCGGAHSYRNCPATDGNVYRDNIQEFVSQASAINYNQGNISYRPPMMNNQKCFNQNQNRGNNFNHGPVYQPPVFQPPAYQAPAYQAPAPQTQGVLKKDFLAYVKANDAVIRNMQTQGQNMQNQLTNLTKLLTKFVNSNSASTSCSGTLPSNTIANPRSDLKAITTRSVSALRPNQRPSIPYPSILQDQKLRDKVNDQREKFFQIFKDLNFNISFVDALILMPNSPKEVPEKLRDPGKFLIPCDFFEKDECLALVDLGASINLMPLSMWNTLSIPYLSPTCMTLELADRSISCPVGVIEDVYVKVGTFRFPADFVVVDFDVDPRVPLILRRSFLKTGRALIDVFEDELTLRVGKEAITFNLDQTSRYSANYNDMMAKRIDIIDMACKEYSQEVLVNLIASSSSKSSYTKGDVLEGGGVSSNVTLSYS